MRFSMKAQHDARCAGRPKDLSKRSAILSAARRHFMRHGFSGISMDAIASSAGVSKLTVYSHFGSKEGLFKEVIRDECTRLLPQENFDSLLGLSPREALMTIGVRFLDLLFQPDSLALHRVMISEAIGNPKISELFYEAGPAHVKNAFTSFLQALHDRGALLVEQPEHATQHFFSLLKGEMHSLALLSLPVSATPEALRGHLEDVVSIFLRACAIPAAAAGVDRPS